MTAGHLRLGTGEVVSRPGHDSAGHLRLGTGEVVSRPGHDSAGHLRLGTGEVVSRPGHDSAGHLRLGTGEVVSRPGHDSAGHLRLGTGEVVSRPGHDSAGHLRLGTGEEKQASHQRLGAICVQSDQHGDCWMMCDISEGRCGGFEVILVQSDQQCCGFHFGHLRGQEQSVFSQTNIIAVSLCLTSLRAGAICLQADQYRYCSMMH